MTATCPAGHASAAQDYCDVCGRPIADASPADSAASKPSFRTEVVAPTTDGETAAERCPNCGTPRSRSGRFCELDGYDFDAVESFPSSAPPAWTIEVATDRDHYERSAPDGIDFPQDASVRTYVLARGELVVGRQHGSETDAGAERVVCGVADPAVSRRHARFVYGDDGCLAVVDEGSTNGTRLNGDAEPLAPGILTRLNDGDRVHVGAWTSITVRAEPVAAPANRSRRGD